MYNLVLYLQIKHALLKSFVNSSFNFESYNIVLRYHQISSEDQTKFVSTLRFIRVKIKKNLQKNVFSFTMAKEAIIESNTKSLMPNLLNQKHFMFSFIIGNPQPNLHTLVDRRQIHVIC